MIDNDPNVYILRQWFQQLSTSWNKSKSWSKVETMWKISNWLLHFWKL
jgi:hypothetical protein